MDDSFWTSEDVARYVKRSKSWVYKRTSMTSPFYPKIPVMPGLHGRFDPKAVRAIFPMGSLSIEQSLITPPNLLPMRRKKKRTRL